MTNAIQTIVAQQIAIKKELGIPAENNIDIDIESLTSLGYRDKKILEKKLKNINLAHAWWLIWRRVPKDIWDTLSPNYIQHTKEAIKNITSKQIYYGIEIEKLIAMNVFDKVK